MHLLKVVLAIGEEVFVLCLLLIFGELVRLFFLNDVVMGICVDGEGLVGVLVIRLIDGDFGFAGIFEFEVGVHIVLDVVVIVIFIDFMNLEQIISMDLDVRVDGGVVGVFCAFEVELNPVILIAHEVLEVARVRAFVTVISGGAAVARVACDKIQVAVIVEVCDGELVAVLVVDVEFDRDVFEGVVFLLMI